MAVFTVTQLPLNIFWVLVSTAENAAVKYNDTNVFLAWDTVTSLIRIGNLLSFKKSLWFNYPKNLSLISLIYIVH